MSVSRVRIQSIEARPLSARLLEPFVIASARVDATRSVHVGVTLEGDAASVTGIGEAAALRPITREDQPDALAALHAAAPSLEGSFVVLPDMGASGSTDALFAELDTMLSAALPSFPVARAGLETALLDAIARLLGVPLRVLLGGAPGPAELVTDITIPINDPAHMADLARAWRTKGFTAFKIKIGKDVDHDIEALSAIAKAVPGASLRVDANAGFSAAEAIAFAQALDRHRISIACFEQPCATRDLDAMAEVTAAVAAPVLADESVATLADFHRVVAAKAADGVNLKLAKSGGPLAALAIGRAALAAGMQLMVGGMVETRLGMTAAAHVAAALGGADFIDLDTAWLLAEDLYSGGYIEDGPRYTLDESPGHGVAPRGPSP